VLASRGAGIRLASRDSGRLPAVEARHSLHRFDGYARQSAAITLVVLTVVSVVLVALLRPHASPLLFVCTLASFLCQLLVLVAALFPDVAALQTVGNWADDCATAGLQVAPPPDHITDVHAAAVAMPMDDEDGDHRGALPDDTEMEGRQAAVVPPPPPPGRRRGAPMIALDDDAPDEEGAAEDRAAAARRRAERQCQEYLNSELAYKRKDEPGSAAAAVTAASRESLS
jgi:hypothetical protein